MERYNNFLTIQHRGKCIPYGGVGEVREDGDANYGFKDLKSHPEAHNEVPELQRDPAMDRLVRASNGSATGLFSVGCVSGTEEDEGGYRGRGYVEFALNSVSLIANAASYFPLFYWFDQFLHENEYAGDAHFNWELEGATFMDRENIEGFTCTIILNTPIFKTRDDVREAWVQALEYLGVLSPTENCTTVPMIGWTMLFGEAFDSGELRNRRWRCSPVSAAMVFLVQFSVGCAGRPARSKGCKSLTTKT